MAKKPVPKKRSKPKRSKRSFHPIVLILAIPLLGMIAYFAWHFAKPGTAPVASDSGRRSAKQAASPASGSRDPAALERVLRARGDVTVIHSEAGRIVVETPASVEAIADDLRSKLHATVAPAPNGLEATVAGERTIIEVWPFSPGDSGAGLVETEKVITVPPPEKPVASGASRSGEKRIVLILDDVGFDRAILDEAVKIDAHLNFAVIPRTANAASSAEMLSARGYEILCHLPMEPFGYPKISPGEGAILTSMSNDRIRELTLENLDLVPNAIGMNNHMGSRATTDARVMREVIAAARDAGVYFVDSKTSPRSIGGETASRMNVRTLSRDVFLDDVESEASIRRQLATLARFAERHSVAVGIGHVYPVTIRVLQQEIPKLQKRGFRFVKVSEAVNAPATRTVSP